MAAGYREKNKEKRNEGTRLWRKNNPEKAKASVKGWKDANPDRIAEIMREWRAANPDKLKGYDEKRRSTAKGRIDASIRAGIIKSIRRGSKGGKRRFEILGYTVLDLMEHLEKRFLPGMTWDNYGEWHIDHIVPLAAHNYETPDDIDFKRAWALSNLQPLWAIDNMKKGDSLTAPFQPSLALALKGNLPIAANDNVKKDEKEEAA
ncbi:hypothetical protein I7G59_06355 [Sinorhizobium meliloti]|uniref:hypothetical protein n=1 Tax=Rhizobium meliloti TaxID=382 RepID=UPI002380B3DB|nr:hypothetical protein [Sinorhizobium meliloti]MDE3796955.1 hypothetical protein [Sinorhizobium meliloti]